MTALEDGELGARDAGGERLAVGEGRDAVVPAGRHERRHHDRAQPLVRVMGATGRELALQPERRSCVDRSAITFVATDKGHDRGAQLLVVG